MIVGVVLALLGILGFFSSPILGTFSVNTLHNVINLAVGLICIWASSSSESATRMSAKVFGVIFAILAIVGFVSSSSLAFLNVNMADTVLQLVLAVVFLYLGFGSRRMQSM